MALQFINDDNGNIPLYYLPITLGSNAGNGFAQQLTINSSTYSAYEKSDLSNINFQDGAGNLLYSWLESGETNASTSTVYWIKLNGGAITTIYMVFTAKTATSISGTHTGAEPNYTGTYGQYDNGTSVFTNYWNFSGSSLPSGLSATGSNNIYAVSNGLTIGNVTDLGIQTGIIGTSIMTAPQISEILVVSDSITGGTPGFSVEQSTSSTYGTNGYENGYSAGVQGLLTSASDIVLANSTGAVSIVTSGTGITLSNIIGTTWTATGAQREYVNYVSKITGANSTVTYGNYYVSIVCQGGSHRHKTVIQWLRSRTYPSGGTMPTQTPGSISRLNSGLLL